MGFQELDLEGAFFVGEFLANRERILKSLESAEASPMEAGLREYIESLKRDFEPHKFEMKVYSFDKKSGLFVAVGNDVFGPSGITGRVEPDCSCLVGSDWSCGVSFIKTYGTERFEYHDRRPNFSRNFREFQYWGEIDSQRNIRNGIYVPRNGVTGSGGTWKMDFSLPLES